MWGRAFRIERGVLFYGEKSAIINRIGEVGDMGRLDMGVSAKGVGAGIVCGMLLTGYAALSPLCHLTLSPQTVILPLLSVWTGPMSSLICAGAACISSASALGANMAVWMLVKALPGLLCAWLIQQRIGYFRKMAIFLGISAVSALGWAAYESLRAQGHLIANLAEKMAYGPYGAGGICIPGISGYFSAGGGRVWHTGLYDAGRDETVPARRGVRVGGSDRDAVLRRAHAVSGPARGDR